MEMRIYNKEKESLKKEWSHWQNVMLAKIRLKNFYLGLEDIKGDLAAEILQTEINKAAAEMERCSKEIKKVVM